MTYRVEVTDAVARQLRKLPSSVREACDRAIVALGQEPRPHGCRKIAGTFNGWRVVVREDYQLLYTVDDGERVVTVYWAGRKEKDTYKAN
jgi:mRNA interferase RelE/StbE